MTTATGEYAQLPSQFSALSIADPQLPAENNGGGPPLAPRKPWRSPPRRPTEEPRSPPWPAPTREGATHGRRKAPLQRPNEATAMAASGGSSAVESASGDDPIAPAADPPQQQKVEKRAWEEQRRTSDSAAVANSNPRVLRPALLPAPRQQQGRPPQNGRRGRAPYHHNNGDYGGNGSGGNSQQRRPRPHWNASFSHQQPPQIVNGGFYHPMNQPMMGFPNLPPEWGFNAMPILQWGPSPHLAPPYMGALPPPVGPRFSEMFPYPAPPLSPMPPPPPAGWNPPWFVAPVAAPPEVTLQNQPQSPAGSTSREGEDVGAKLRKQIEYYFSDENLMKDTFLRKCMDDHGWVSIQIIANFPRVKSLTSDVGLVLGVLQASDTVEVSVDKLRKKGEWSKWIIRQPLPDANQEPPEG